MRLVSYWNMSYVATCDSSCSHWLMSGAGYSQQTIKTQLKMAVQRLMMHRNKRSNQVSVDSKQVAILLQQAKDESARIRCEAILHEKNLVTAMELLTLMCELLVARTALITASKTCPVDLEEGIASIIYCASRIEVPELKTVSEQIASKYGKDWVLAHTDNRSGKVNQRIIEKLSIQPPPFEVVFAMLKEIAATYQVEWEPDLTALQSGIVDHSNPERLGSIARLPQAAPGLSDDVKPLTPISTPVTPMTGTTVSSSSSSSSSSQPVTKMNDVPPPQSATHQYPLADPHLLAPTVDGYGPGSSSPFPGTLNLIIHRGRNILNLASKSEPHDLYVRLTNLATGVHWSSEPDTHGGNNPIWHGNPHMPNSVHHFPFSVSDATQQIQVELYQRNKGTFGIKDDKLIGQASFYADNLRANPQLMWYGIYLQNMLVGYLLMQSQYIPLHANILSEAELDQQRAWLEQERQQHQATLQPPNGLTPTAPSYSIPPPQTQPTDEPGTPMNYPSTTSMSNTLGDRVAALFHEVPDSPPHSHDKTLSDIHRASLRSNPDEAGSHQPGGMPTQTVDHDAVASSSSSHNDTSAASSSTAVDNADPSLSELDFPSVPTHSAGSGRPRKSSGKGEGKGPHSSAGGGDAGGGTLYAPRPPKKMSEDEELAARFRALNH